MKNFSEWNTDRREFIRARQLHGRTHGSVYTSGDWIFDNLFFVANGSPFKSA